MIRINCLRCGQDLGILGASMELRNIIIEDGSIECNLCRKPIGVTRNGAIIGITELEYFIRSRFEK